MCDKIARLSSTTECVFTHTTECVFTRQWSLNEFCGLYPCRFPRFDMVLHLFNMLMLKEGTCLAFKWLVLWASTAGGMDLTPGWKIEDPAGWVTWPEKKKKKSWRRKESTGLPAHFFATPYKSVSKSQKSGLPGGPGAKLHASNAEGPGSIPGQEARFHMLQLRLGTVKEINILK